MNEKPRKNIIIMTGPKGVGKTTLLDRLKTLLKDKNIYYPEHDMSFILNRELKLQYDTLKENPNNEEITLFVESKVLDTFKNIFEKINFDLYDFIILDRTHLDDYIFANVGLKNKEYLKYLEEKRNEIHFNMNRILDVFYINTSESVMVKRLLSRGRNSEANITINYLKNLHRAYKIMINDIYPVHHEYANETELKNWDKFIIDRYNL
ncbi:10622_t:CDS:1 [Scutellospora calospora]|uniref:10622_t:CDS:1 n=1 Tax=Scutellospora calospora TaxID=85575 RepID=A0ACA9LRS0_9GLOM|nr:10622_t:CDS:1 [Scutellospora calospora]